jgi:flagellin
MSGAAVNGIEVSTDGGVNFGAQIAVAGTTATNIGNGLTFAMTTNATNNAGDTWTFSATASNATVRLADSAGTTPIGAAVTVKNNATTATIGDSSVDATVDVAFNFSTLTTSLTNSTLVSVASVASSGAVTDSNGNVTTEAKAAAGINVSTQAKANTAITTIDSAIRTVSTTRSKLGANQNRLEHTIANLGTSSENLTAAESRVRDVDMAKEMMEFTKNNILSQAAQAMLAQANQQPQGVLQLLR